MRLKLFVPLLVLSLWSAGAAVATPGQDIVIASLRSQGFEVVLVHWTLLGRIRIVAESGSIRREIVINPNTGEILRDYSRAIEVAETAPRDRSGNNHSPAAVGKSIDATAVTALDALANGIATPMFAEPGPD